MKRYKHSHKGRCGANKKDKELCRRLKKTDTGQANKRKYENGKTAKYAKT